MLKNLKTYLEVCNELGQVCKRLASDPFNEELSLRREQLLDRREEFFNGKQS